jgi:hypothetical protein
VPSLDRLPANQPNQQEYERDDEEDVQPSAERCRGHDPNQPEHHKQDHQEQHG